MALGTWPSIEPFYEVAERFVANCLGEDGSLFTPGRSIWSREVVDELAPSFLQQQHGAASFSEKLSSQVEGLGDAAKQLAAEILFVHLMPIADVSLEAKLDRIGGVLNTLDEPVSIPDEIAAGLGPGFASYGAARAQAPNQVRYLGRFAQAWKSIDRNEQERMLADPWAFKTWLNGLERPGAQSQFEALLHIVHPQTFEPIISWNVKKKIAQAYQPVLEGESPGDWDEALLEIRRRLEPVAGDRFSFYEPRFHRGWAEASSRWDEFVHWAKRVYSRDDFDASERDYKLEIAAKLRTARERLDDEDWLVVLRAAFGAPNNLTHWRDHEGFLGWAAEHPGEARDFLRALWGGGSSAQMRGALNRIPASAVTGRASRTTLASFLLGGVDITIYPTFRMTVYEKTASLVGREIVRADASVADLYDDFLLLLDELRIQLLLAGTATRDRLDAQSLAWWVSVSEPPDDWSDADKRALEAFRSGGRLPSPHRAWLVRGENAYGTNLVPRWLEEGFISISRVEEGEQRPGMTRDEIAAQLVALGIGTPQQARPWADIGNRFLNLMQPGDLLFTVAGDSVFFAVVTGEPEWHHDAEPGTANRRTVRWLNAAIPNSRSELPESARRLMKPPTVIDMTAAGPDLARLAGVGWRGADGDDEETTPPSVIPAATRNLAESLLLPLDWLQEAIDLLNEKGQVIFYGPPGTGKTYVAQELGKHVAAQGGTWRLVQFHPAYSYEDFFEGYRPEQQDDSGGLAFSLRHGPLREIAEAARDRPNAPHLLVIDEINRGNLAKIFGELYFLLEYRDRGVRLQYSAKEEFSLPPNLFFIGTMNTADRSIALVDSALRRRFYFVPFLPGEEPVRGILRRWLDAAGYELGAADLVDTLNEVLAERGGGEDEFAIGPSYFITKEGPPDVERVWKHAIMPLLEERFYAQQTRAQIAADFGLAAIDARRRGMPPSGSDPDASTSLTGEDDESADPAPAA